MRGERNTDRSVRKFITIRDTELWEKIDRIMEEKKYSKSFNKVINDALYYGLDELMRHLFELEETVAIEQEQAREQKLIRRVDGVNETYVLTNERYIGECLLQKKYTPEILPLRSKINRGELPKYLYTNSHEPIITKQGTLRKQRGSKYYSERKGKKAFFSDKIYCRQCARVYKRQKNVDGNIGCVLTREER